MEGRLNGQVAISRGDFEHVQRMALKSVGAVIVGIGSDVLGQDFTGAF